VKSEPLPAASDPILVAVARAQARHNLFPAPDRDTRTPVVVAVSGGADSVCLLHALRHFAPHWHLDLQVAHVNHRLRPSAAADHDFVAALAGALNLQFHDITLDPAALHADPQGVEAAARAARYAFLYQVARRISSGKAALQIAVAHHAGDQAETLLLHLAQGAGLRGLGGMAAVSDLPTAAEKDGPPVRLLRPLLAVQREDIEAYLCRHNLNWIQDESNADLRIARNHVRHVVLPALAVLNANIVATLARSAEILAAEAQRTQAADTAALEQLLTEPVTAVHVVLDLLRWRNLGVAARRGVLRAALEYLAADGRDVGFEHVAAIDRSAVPERSSGPHPLAGGIAWSVVGAANGYGARLCLHAAAATPYALEHPLLDAAWQRLHPDGCPLPLPGTLHLGDWQITTRLLSQEDLPTLWQSSATAWRLFVDAGTLGEPLLIAPRPGLRIAPLGMGGKHRSVADVLGSHRIPATMRGRWPLLVDRRDGRVLWVCGLHSAESLRVTQATQQVICLEWTKSETGNIENER
jgi:tRNA(Ile)-lysidine synthase